MKQETTVKRGLRGWRLPIVAGAWGAAMVSWSYTAPYGRLPGPITGLILGGLILLLAALLQLFREWAGALVTPVLLAGALFAIGPAHRAGMRARLLANRDRMEAGCRRILAERETGSMPGAMPVDLDLWPGCGSRKGVWCDGHAVYISFEGNPDVNHGFCFSPSGAPEGDPIPRSRSRFDPIEGPWYFWWNHDVE